MPVNVTLPWPVSANRRLIPARGRWVLDSKYRAWKETAAFELLAQLQAAPHEQLPVGPRAFVGIWVHEPDKRRRDLDNLAKPVLDALQAAGILRNDSDVDELMIARDVPVMGGQLRVRVTNS